MTVLILYFSGTGNTKRVAEEFKARLIENGASVIMHSIEEKTDIAKIAYDYLILGFPKYYEYPVLIMPWYLKKNLPKREKPIPTLAFCTQAGPLKTDFTGLERLLKKRNHRLTVEVSLPYANNMMIFKAFHPMPQPELLENQKNIRSQVGSLLEAFLKGETVAEHTTAWQRPLIIFVAEACTKLMPVFAMRLSADENCTGCGLCAKRCPVQNISIKEGKPVFHKHCLFCMRCINSCPTNAIRYNGRKCAQYQCGPFPQSADNEPIQN